MSYLDPTAGEAREELNDGAGGGSADLSAIAEDVLPAADDTYDLGSQAKRWQDVWLSGAPKFLNAAGDGFLKGPAWEDYEFTSDPGVHYDVDEIAEGFLYLDPDYGGYYALLGGLSFKAYNGGTYENLFDETAADPESFAQGNYGATSSYLQGPVATELAPIGNPGWMGQIANYWDGAASQQVKVEADLVISATDPLAWTWTLLAGFLELLKFDEEGVPTLPTLPTIDTEVAGQLYEDPITHAVTVSQGA